MHTHTRARLLSTYSCLALDGRVCSCGLLGAATLPRLLMSYVLLIRMSCLSPAICTSWLANPLPTVWCRQGARRRAHDSVPAPDLKRPLCFVVLFKSPRKDPDVLWVGWQPRGGEARWVRMASAKGTSPSLSSLDRAGFVLAAAYTEKGRGDIWTDEWTQTGCTKRLPVSELQTIS